MEYKLLEIWIVSYDFGNNSFVSAAVPIKTEMLGPFGYDYEDQNSLGFPFRMVLSKTNYSEWQ